MNPQLQTFARQTLKDGLAQLPDGWQWIFKLMYSHNNPNLPINKVVDRMPEGKLDWAMQQVENSIKKLQKQNPL